MRITKEPEVRRKELIVAAGTLFKEKGCEQTSISDIVKKVGVAQGTFYYYFESKDAVLDAVLNRYLKEQLEPAARGIIENRSLNALQKIQQVINTALTIQSGERKLLEFLHSDKNILSHQKYMQMIRQTFIPIITKLVEEGIDEGLFNVKYPAETVELMIVMFIHLHDSIAMSGHVEEYGRKVRATEAITAKVLGIEEGCISLCPYKKEL
jgi:AcrR family transcriptional regulator